MSVKEALEEAESYKGTKKEKMLSAANVSFITYEENTITTDTVSQSELKISLKIPRNSSDKFD